MNYINSDLIKSFFSDLNNSEIEYALIKNIGNELPDFLVPGKDIDIIVNAACMKDFHEFMKKRSRRYIHPRGPESGWHNMYGLKNFEFWRLNTSDDIFIDVTYQLCCHSLMPNIWLPLDNQIQVDVWKNKVYDTEHNWWTLDKNVEFAYLLARCIFDKQSFSNNYRDLINSLYKIIDIGIVKRYLNLIFFNYTDELLLQISNDDYDNIISRYLSCHNY